MTKQEYDRQRYKSIRSKRVAQMLAYRRKHRARLARNEAERRASMGERYRANRRADYAANKDKYLARNRGYLYRGLSAPTRDEPKACECCGGKTKRSLHVDHEHTGRKRFRGWLCSKCNTGIGLLGDCVAGLRRAIKYVETYDRRNKAKRRFGRELSAR